MIYVNHDQSAAMTIGDRIGVMNNVKVQQIDTPLKLYNEPDNLFVAGFLGSPPMNFINGELKQERDAIVFKEMQGGTIQVRFADRPQAREFLANQCCLGFGRKTSKVLNFRKREIRPRGFRRSWTSSSQWERRRICTWRPARTPSCAGVSAFSIIARPVIGCSSSSMLVKRICSIRRPQVVSSKGFTMARFYANLVAWMHLLSVN